MSATELAPGFSALKEAVADRYDLSEPLPLNDAAQLLREVIDLQADLALVRGDLEKQLAERMEEDHVDTPWGTLERRYRPQGARWDGRRLAFAVVERIAPADENGEPYEPAELIERTTEELIAVGGLDRPSFGWRKGELKSRGIDYRSFCEVSGGWRTEVRFA